MSSRLAFTHPNRKRLKNWLDAGLHGAGDEADPGVTTHVEHCERCAARLEEMALEPGEPDPVLDEQLGDAIREAFTPPTDLNDRVMKKISERERADQEMTLLFGLFAIAKDAAELMLPPESTASTAPRTLDTPSSPPSDDEDNEQSREDI